MPNRDTAATLEYHEATGTGGAVHLARSLVHGPVLILFADSLFDADLGAIERIEADGVTWVREVEHYQRFGIILTDEAGFMTDVIEKPENCDSRLANIGRFYMRDWQALFEGLERLVAGPAVDGEWYLTYACRDMLQRGRRIATAPVTGWYDCGKLDALLETNRHILENGQAFCPALPANARVTPPVRIAEDVVLERCEIGPNVCIESGSVPRSSVVRNSLIGQGCQIHDSRILGSLLGDAVSLGNARLEREIVATRGRPDAP